MAYRQRAHASMNLSKLISSLLFLLIAINTAQASPQISFPINAQVPPVGRVDALFDFTFSANTFSGAALDLSYSISNAPSWLSVNSTTRRFAGTPRQDDKGSTVFNLIATDSTGSASMPVTFVVLDTTGPQLAETSVLIADAFSGPDSVLVTPGTTVAISLGSSTFINTNAGTQYYAVCSDNSPLPSWLIFDSANLSFSGTSPDASSPSQLPEIHDLHVIATDVPGFSSAVFQFRLTIDLHELVFSSERIDVNVTDGQAFNYTGLKDNLTLDREVIDLSLITNVQVQSSSWLLVDNNTLDVSGTPPQGFDAQSFWVYVQDTYGDEANTTIFLSTNASTPLLGPNVPSINVFCGETVSYTISADAFAVDDFETSVNLGNCSSWLTYNPQTLTFTGKVPPYCTPQVYYINLAVTKGSQSVSEAIPVTVNRSKVPVPSPNAPTFPPSNTTNGTSNSNATAPSLSNSESNMVKNATIASLVIPIVAAFIFAGVLIWYKKKKRTPVVLPKTEAKGSRAASRTSEYRLESLRGSPVGFDEDWYPGFSEPPTASSSSNRQGARRSFAKHPNLSFISSIAQKAKPKKQRAAPLVSPHHIGLGHGSIALQNCSTAPNQRPKHIAIHIPIQAHLPNNESDEHVASPNDSYKTTGSIAQVAQHYAPLDHEKMVHPRSNRYLQRSSHVGGQLTIREVAKSPTPSEFPSPDINSSPLTKQQSYLHHRATERKTSGLFSSASAQRTTEQGIIAPAPAVLNTSTKSSVKSRMVSTPAHIRATHTGSKFLRDSDSLSNTDDRIALFKSWSKADTPEGTKKASYDSSSHDDSWTDDTGENAEPNPLVRHTGSSQALFRLVTPSIIVDPVRGTRIMTPEPRRNGAMQSDDSLDLYGSGTRPTHRRSTHRHLNENRSSKNPRGNTAFP